MGCKQYDTVIVGNKNESRCIKLVVLDDAWEFDVLKAFAGQNPFSKLETSPRLSGMMGLSPSTLPNSDSRILMFGGTSVFHARALIYQESPRPTNASFEVRSIEFRSRKASRAELQNMRQLSFSVGLHNDTHVLLFGGFIGNSLSSALYAYEMSAQQPSLGFTLVNTWSPLAPEARSYPGLVIQGDTLFMFGGFRDGEGKSDLWKLDIVSSVWRQVSKEARNYDKILKLAFNAFSTMSLVKLMSRYLASKRSATALEVKPLLVASAAYAALALAANESASPAVVPLLPPSLLPPQALSVIRALTTIVDKKVRDKFML
jgi:hypothetical protein